ncbi:MAG: type II toxin-antitoxin system ParD family antitoxin [bacterium]|nr:type II toxin-antitoxin system ParD family antitoxin [bacterium]
MNVSVGKELEEFARSKVATGDYASLSEVVRDGLRLLKEKDRILAARLEALRGKTPDGNDQKQGSQGPDDGQDLRWIRREVED